MTSYWYSTNGMDQRKLSNKHMQLLDEAFERRTRVQIYDEEALGHSIPAIANPYQGTMSAGDIHYGLYRYPSLWQMDEEDGYDLDTSLLMNINMSLSTSSTSLTSSTTTKNNNSNTKNRFQQHQHKLFSYSKQSSHHHPYSQRRKSSSLQDDPCYCCIIS
ncbi:hypothetical protein BJ944DRAFT_268855 [Cunninghamella echinulata]|nr:hypothetical protein BJ944DRAFT_268855 [Cunninghamella echinulata]